MRDAARTHLSQYLGIVWRRRRLFLVVFLLVGVGSFARALFLEPVYRSHTIIQIEGDEMGGLLGELKALESSSNAETEMEIMRSFLVAEDAFSRLSPNDFLYEEHAYRPFDVLVDKLRGRKPCALSVETALVESGAPPETLIFDFTGADLRVEHRVVNADPRFFDVKDFEFGVPFSVGGRKLTLRTDRDSAGRRFRLDLRSRVDGARWIRRFVRVREMGRRTGVVRLEFEAPSPALCTRVAAALASSYLDLKKAQRREKLVKALEFLGDQTGRVRDRLKEAEDSLDRFRAESGTLMLSERARWLVERAAKLELEQTELDLSVRELQRLGEELDSDSGSVVVLRALGDVDPITRSFAEGVVRLEFERDALEQQGVRKAHPQRASIEEELQRARRRLKEGLRAGLEMRLGTLERRGDELGRSRATTDNEARQLPQTERTAAKLLRSVKANLKIYNLLVEREQGARVALASTLATARLIDRPLRPIERSSPLLFLQALVAFVLAVATATVCIAFFEYMDRTVKSARELEQATDLPLFATIPSFGARRRFPLRGMASDLVVWDRPTSVPSESYRALRTNLGYARLEHSLSSIAITSAGQGEGKTATVCNLAVACAQAGERTLLLDADLRRPATHTRFAHSQAPGLAEVLAGQREWRDLCIQTAIDNLHSIPAGAHPGDPCTLLGSDAFSKLISELSHDYDTILVDVPPILAVADTGAVLPHVDGALLLVRYGRHPVEVALDARERIARSGTKLLGVIFNALDLRATPRHAYGAYGVYSGYEDTADESRGARKTQRRKANA